MNPEYFNPSLWIAFTSIMLFSYWLVYCMGSPLASNPRDIDTGGILFFIPLAMARRRLKENDLLARQRTELTQSLLATSDPKTRQEFISQYREDIMVLGRMFFAWERSFLCPICLHWWLTVLVVLLALMFGWADIYTYPLQTAFVYLVNHFIIRKIS
jgi:hypothetical protein